jgi:hypothetical protein
MDGSVLVKTLSDDADDDVRNRLKDGHSRYYQETASMLTPLLWACELITASAMWDCRWCWRPRCRRMS